MRLSFDCTQDRRAERSQMRACGPTDRAAASEAAGAGSIPARRNKIELRAQS